jgi:type II secretory pathway component PulM
MTTSVLHRRTARQTSSRKARLRAPRILRGILIAIAVVLVLAVVVRLIVDPIATRQTRRALDRLQGFRGDFERVHVTLFSPAYEITRLKLIQIPEHRGDEPVVYAEKVRAGLNGSQLLRGRLVAAIRIDEPKLVITSGPEKKAPAPKKKAAPDLSMQLQETLPF